MGQEMEATQKGGPLLGEWDSHAPAYPVAALLRTIPPETRSRHVTDTWVPSRTVSLTRAQGRSKLHFVVL